MPVRVRPSASLLFRRPLRYSLPEQYFKGLFFCDKCFTYTRIYSCFVRFGNIVFIKKMDCYFRFFLLHLSLRNIEKTGLGNLDGHTVDPAGFAERKEAEGTGDHDRKRKKGHGSVV